MAEALTHIRPVETRKDLRSFIDLPYSLYSHSPHWIPPVRLNVAHMLSPKKNPFFRHGEIKLFIAKRGAEFVGRIAAVRNGMHLRRYDDGTGFFRVFRSRRAL